VTETLSAAATATLSTHGAAGIQANVFPCEAVELSLYILVPRTSDHLFNLEQNAEVVVTTEAWQLRGLACIGSECRPDLALLRLPDAGWCEVVKIDPRQLQIVRAGESGYAETIDIY
jgi:hypothetical protein